MAQQNINNGSYDNDANADTLRAGFEKINNNFTELYDLVKTKITKATASRNFAADEEIVFVTANADLTLKSTLPPDYNVIVKMRESDDYTCNILAGTGVTIEPSTFSLTKGKMCSIIRFPNSNTYIISQ